jgi:hypothetical protein
MKKEFENLDDVAQVLGDGGSFDPDKEYETVRDVVEDLIDLGNTDKVYAYHDDHLGLMNDLSPEFLNTELIDLDNDKFEQEIEMVLEQANLIIPLSKKTLSEDDIEHIKEDILYRGGDPDDFPQ